MSLQLHSKTLLSECSTTSELQGNKKNLVFLQINWPPLLAAWVSTGVHSWCSLPVWSQSSPPLQLHDFVQRGPPSLWAGTMLIHMPVDECLWRTHSWRPNSSAYFFSYVKSFLIASGWNSSCPVLGSFVSVFKLFNKVSIKVTETSFKQT